MTSWIVIDNHILIAAAIVETYTAQAEALLRWIQAEEINVAAPNLIRYESVAVLRKLAHRGTITPQNGEELLRAILERPIHLVMNADLLMRAYQMASELGMPSAYDAQYLAVAERLNCAFWTGDRRLFNAVQARYSWVKYIADYPLPPVLAEA